MTTRKRVILHKQSIYKHQHDTLQLQHSARLRCCIGAEGKDASGTNEGGRRYKPSSCAKSYAVARHLQMAGALDNCRRNTKPAVTQTADAATRYVVPQSQSDEYGTDRYIAHSTVLLGIFTCGWDTRHRQLVSPTGPTDSHLTLCLMSTSVNLHVVRLPSDHRSHHPRCGLQHK